MAVLRKLGKRVYGNLLNYFCNFYSESEMISKLKLKEMFTILAIPTNFPGSPSILTSCLLPLLKKVSLHILNILNELVGDGAPFEHSELQRKALSEDHWPQSECSKWLQLQSLQIWGEISDSLLQD